MRAGEGREQMELYGMECSLRHRPVLDPDFYPILRYNRAFLATADKPVSVAVERTDGKVAA